MTVGDLEEAIKESKKLPKKITVHDDSPANVGVTANGIITLATTGAATAVRDATITSSLVMRYSATGKYYSSGSTKYWSSALGANIQIAEGGSGTYYYQIDSIRQLTNAVKNASTSSSYLQMSYNYTVGCYFGVKGIGGIKINSFNVSGSSNFDKSYIP